MSVATIRVAVPPKLAPARPIREDSVPYWIPDNHDTVSVEPIYRRGGYGVYKHPVDGMFMVFALGRPEGRPFRTFEPELAKTVCDRWAQEFPPIYEFGEG